ncbi:MAG: trigger factor [Anaerolineales bacterium]
MKVETEILEQRQAQMTVEVPEDKMQKALRTAARRISKEIKVPGFRPGKAPYNIVAQKVGEDYLLDEALDEIGQDIYQQALEEAELEPFAPGTLDEIVSREPLVLRYTVPLEPEIDIGDYRDIRVEYEAPEVSDEDVEEVMEQLRQGQALIEPVDRPAEEGDVVVVNVTGKLVAAADDEQAEDEPLMEEDNASLLVEEETDWPIPGISQHLIGLEAGQEIEIEHIFDEEYPSEELRGRSANFHFTCLEVKSRIVPEWTDSLAQNLGDFDDLLSLRIKVRENLEQELESRLETNYRDDVMDKVVETAKVIYPPYLLEREIDDMLHDLQHRLERQQLSLQDYLNMEGRTLEDMREDYREEAEARLLRGLVLGRIVEAEGLEAQEQEIDEAIDEFVEPLGENAQEVRQRLDNPATRRQIELDLLTDKAVKRLISIAKGEAESDLELVEDTGTEDEQPGEAAEEPEPVAPAASQTDESEE